MYCGLNTASDLSLIFTTQLYQYFSVFFLLFALFSDESEVFHPKYSQTAILHAADFRRVVKPHYCRDHNNQRPHITGLNLTIIYQIPKVCPSDNLLIYLFCKPVDVLCKYIETIVQTVVDLCVYFWPGDMMSPPPPPVDSAVGVPFPALVLFHYARPLAPYLGLYGVQPLRRRQQIVHTSRRLVAGIMGRDYVRRNLFPLTPSSKSHSISIIIADRV